MVITNTYITNPDEAVEKKPPIIRHLEWCQDQDPKPVYCELPDLGKDLTASGTQPTYTYTSSMVSLPNIGTPSTTTTL
ncbi:hypothetical protein ACFL18_00635 [Patescibacteria group bacterium]